MTWMLIFIERPAYIWVTDNLNFRFHGITLLKSQIMYFFFHHLKFFFYFFLTSYSYFVRIIYGTTIFVLHLVVYILGFPYIIRANFFLHLHGFLLHLHKFLNSKIILKSVEFYFFFISKLYNSYIFQIVKFVIQFCLYSKFNSSKCILENKLSSLKFEI